MRFAFFIKNFFVNHYFIITVSLHLFHCTYFSALIPLHLLHCTYFIALTSLYLFHYSYFITLISLSLFHGPSSARSAGKSKTVTLNRQPDFRGIREPAEL